MYSFYEDIKKEIDLQDLSEYVFNPLNRLKLLELKLNEYKKVEKKNIEIVNSNNELTKLTSKDLLLNNVAKLIEHIQIIEDKYYSIFSFEILVNRRIISELGFQDDFINAKNNEIKCKI